MLNREKCQNCKYWRHEFSEWDYQTHVYCKQGINQQDEIDKCELDKDEYNIIDYLDDCIWGIVIVFCVGLFALISTICS